MTSEEVRNSIKLTTNNGQVHEGIYTLYDCEHRLAEKIDPRAPEHMHEIARDDARCGDFAMSCKMMRKYGECPKGYPDIRGNLP